MSVIRKRPFIEKILGDLPSSNDFNYLHHLLDTNVSEPTELSLIDSDRFPVYDELQTQLYDEDEYILVKTGIKSTDSGSVDDVIYNDDRSIFYTNLDGETEELKKGDSVSIIWYEDSERFSLTAGNDGINIDYDDIPFDKIKIKCNEDGLNVSSCSFFYFAFANLTGPVTLANFELDANTKRTGFFIWGDNYVSFIAYHRFQDLELYEITKNADDELVGTYTKIKEYCDINELRRALDDYAENQVVHTIDTHTDNLFVMDELEVSEGCGLGENLVAKIQEQAGGSGKYLHQIKITLSNNDASGNLYGEFCFSIVSSQSAAYISSSSSWSALGEVMRGIIPTSQAYSQGFNASGMLKKFNSSSVVTEFWQPVFFSCPSTGTLRILNCNKYTQNESTGLITTTGNTNLRIEYASAIDTMKDTVIQL